jgi:glutamyl/glutaminyl-tRNA synthetase
LPEAIVNFLGCLSYTFSKEILSKEEMVEEFELAKVHKSGAVFDIKKLNWINSQWIKKLSPAEFKKVSGLDVPDTAVTLITERLEKLSDAREFSYLWQMPEYDSGLLIWKTSSQEEVKQSLEKTAAIIDLVGTEDSVFRAELEKAAVESGNKGLVFWPLRVALSGKDKSPDPVQIASVLGQEESLKRVQKAIRSLSD